MLKRFATCLFMVFLSATPASAQLDAAKHNFDAQVGELNGQLDNITALNLVARRLERLAADDTCNRDRMQFVWTPRTNPPIPATFESPIREIIKCRRYLREEARALYDVQSNFMKSYAHTRVAFDQRLANFLGSAQSQLVGPLADSAFVLHWNASSAGIDCSSTTKPADIAAAKAGLIKSLSDALDAHDIYASRVALYDILTKSARAQARSDICATNDLDKVADAWGDVAEVANTTASAYVREDMRKAACQRLALRKVDYPTGACMTSELTPEVEYTLHEALRRASVRVYSPLTLPPKQ
jgi:hypothetical protein